MSVKTMRYVSAVPRAKADGLVARIYDMIAEDFFINGSLTGHSKVPPLLAGVWTGGRECILVTDRLDRTDEGSHDGRPVPGQRLPLLWRYAGQLGARRRQA